MNLDSWLDYIQRLHPEEIELGLDRVASVATSMGLDHPTSRVITVGGTNGKGSCVAVLEALLLANGLRVGCYTSPHLHRYNERVRIQGKQVTDAALCDAFQRVESARAEIVLTYFEFGTLAALWLFGQLELDVIVLEVGLGGRLDAVNIIEPDVAVITSIDIDHRDWLGDNRELIGIEKAGIIRAGKPFICAETSPPRSLLNHVETLGVSALQRNKEYGIEQLEDDSWRWWGVDTSNQPLELRGLPTPVLSSRHVATALQTLHTLDIKVSDVSVPPVMKETTLAGRFETLYDRQHDRNVLFDVAHNPAAAELLAARLELLRQRGSIPGRIIAVLAMMADKDTKGFCQALELVVDSWCIAQVDQARSMPASQLVSQMGQRAEAGNPLVFNSTDLAFQQACINSQPQDLILVTGSFYTVAEIRELIQAANR